MSDRPKGTLVGAFVIGGALLVVLAVALWGSGRLMERKYRYVCYFSGSVNGLNVGAPVKYRGVSVGTVFDIRVKYAQSLDDPRIPVFIEVYGKRLRELGARRDPNPEMIADLLRMGMRAQLDVESLVTGQLYVNLDLFPDGAVKKIQKVGPYFVIPTTTTTLEQAGQLLSKLLVDFEEFDFGGIARSLAKVVDGLDRIFNQPGWGDTAAELPRAVRALDRLAGTLDAQVKPLGKSLRSTSDEARVTLATLREGLGGAKALVAPQGPFMVELQRTLADMQKAAASVRRLAEYLERNPNALVVGKKRP